MKTMQALRTISIGAVLLFAAGLYANAEVFNPPAIRPATPFGPPAVAPAATATIEGEHFFPSPGSQLHNYHFQTLAQVLLYRNRRFALSGSSILLFEMQRDPANQWYFWASAILTDLTLRAQFKVADLTAGLEYHHACEHDLDTYRGRQPISDSLEATITPIRTEKLVLTGGLTYYLPPVFQDYTPLADLAAASASVDWQPLKIAGEVGLFVQANLQGILKRPGYLDANWMLRTGLAFPASVRGVAVYGEVQRLTDDWVAANPTPITLFSVGLSLGASGLAPSVLAARR